MGSFCSCLHVELPEDSTDETTRGGCKCPGCLFNTFFSKNAKVITRDERTNNEAAILDPNAAPNNALTETIVTRSITLPLVPDQMISNNQHEVFTELGGSVADQLHEVTEQQTRSREVQAEQKSDDHNSESLNNPSHEQLDSGDYFTCTWADDEDECPTCLEVYDSENPKILTECNHHFHLGCIYEWMERSETCPICSKVVVFSERS